MLKDSRVIRYGVTALAVAALTCAGSAVANADQLDDDAVDINVDIAPVEEGFLALSVAAASTDLVEVTSDDPLVREFTGALPTVTVTDTRNLEPETGSYWAVLGSASDFVKNDDDAVTIGAEHLGWTPRLAADYGPDIDAGEPVETIVDDPASEGLSTQDTEILYINWDPTQNVGQGPWSAAADLTLKVPAAGLQAGSYTSVLTLSLFE